MQVLGGLRSSSASWLAPPPRAGVKSSITITCARLHSNLASSAWPLVCLTHAVVHNVYYLVVRRGQRVTHGMPYNTLLMMKVDCSCRRPVH